MSLGLTASTQMGNDFPENVGVKKYSHSPELGIAVVKHFLPEGYQELQELSQAKNN